jgi:hypothetical protein
VFEDTIPAFAWRDSKTTGQIRELYALIHLPSRSTMEYVGINSAVLQNVVTLHLCPVNMNLMDVKLFYLEV